MRRSLGFDAMRLDLRGTHAGLILSRAGEALAGGRTVTPPSLYPPYSLCSPAAPWVLLCSAELVDLRGNDGNNRHAQTGTKHAGKIPQENQPINSSSTVPFSNTQKRAKPILRKKAWWRKVTNGRWVAFCHRPNGRDLLEATGLHSKNTTRAKSWTGAADDLALFGANRKGGPTKGSKKTFPSDFSSSLFFTRRGGSGFFEQIGGPPLVWRRSREADVRERFVALRWLGRHSLSVDASCARRREP